MPSISLALTCYSDGRARNVSFKRISSDQFRLLQTGSMDVSRDLEHDRTHLRDLINCSARSVVSPVSGVGKRGSFPTSQIPKRGFGHVISLQFRDTPFKKLRKPASSIPKHTQTLCPAAPGICRNTEADSLVRRCRSDSDLRFRFREGTTHPQNGARLFQRSGVATLSLPIAGFWSPLLLYHLVKPLARQPGVPVENRTAYA